MSCGSVYTAQNHHRGDLRVTVPTAEGRSPPWKLHLFWPATVTYSSPDDIENFDIQATLARSERFHVNGLDRLDSKPTDFAEVEQTSSELRETLAVVPDPDTSLPTSSQESSYETVLAAGAARPTPIEIPLEVRQSGNTDQGLPHNRIHQRLAAQDEIRVLLTPLRLRAQRGPP